VIRIALFISNSNITVLEYSLMVSLVPLPLPASADPSKFKDFGIEVRGVHPGDLSAEEFKEIEKALYQVKIPL